MASPAGRVVLCGGEEQGGWMSAEGVASRTSFAFALALGAEAAPDPGPGLAAASAAIGRLRVEPDARAQAGPDGGPNGGHWVVVAQVPQ